MIDAASVQRLSSQGKATLERLGSGTFDDNDLFGILRTTSGWDDEIGAGDPKRAETPGAVKQKDPGVDKGAAGFFGLNLSGPVGKLALVALLGVAFLLWRSFKGK